MNVLTQWGRVTHICVSKVTIIGSDNGFSPRRRQAIIWTNAGILLIGLLGTHFSDIFIENHTFWFKKCNWKCRVENDGHFVSASMYEINFFELVCVYFIYCLFIENMISINPLRKIRRILRFFPKVLNCEIYFFKIFYDIRYIPFVHKSSHAVSANTIRGRGHIYASVRETLIAMVQMMMTWSNGNIFALLALLRGLHRSPMNSPHKGQWRWAMMFSFICAWINAWVNNREAGDLRHHRAHYDVIMFIMTSSCSLWRHCAHCDVIVCRTFSVKPLSELMLGCCLIRPLQTNFSGKIQQFFTTKLILICPLQNGDYFLLASTSKRIWIQIDQQANVSH